MTVTGQGDTTAGGGVAPSRPRVSEARRLGWFLAVGTAAALVHLSVAWLLVGQVGMSPLNANVIAFAVAFFVGFAGHSSLTFAGTGARWLRALPRFAAVAIAGFLTNQAAYAVLLERFGERWYLPLLALVLIAVAAATYLLGRVWAFADAGRSDRQAP
ncbi:MAG: GtrA family protein [Burkholderiaceae bacterium]